MALITCTVNPGGGADYTSLAAAEAGMRATYANLRGDGNSIRFNCAGGVDANAVSFGTSWLTDATHTITIYVASADRHTGTRGTGYRLGLNTYYTNNITLTCGYAHINGLAIYNNGNDAGQTGIRAEWGTGNNQNVYFIENCLFYDFHDIGISANTYLNRTIVTNSIFLNCDQGVRSSGNSTTYIYHCTALDSGTYGYFTEGYCYIIAKNSYTGGSGTADYGYERDISEIARTNCHSSDTTGNTQTSVANCSFTGSTPGSEDIHLGSDSDLIGVGADLSGDAIYPVSDDFEGTTRAVTPCIGAQEYVADEPSEFPYTGSGSITSSGSAGHSLNLSFSGSGTATLGGTGDASPEVRYAGSGTITLTGTAVTGYLSTFAYTGTGSLSASGEAVTASRYDYGYPGSGLVSTGGNATLSLILAITGSGSINMQGTADTEYYPVYVYDGTGILYTGGGTYPTFLYTGTGKVTLSGDAVTAYVDTTTFTYRGNGHIQIGGSPPFPYWSHRPYPNGQCVVINLRAVYDSSIELEAVLSGEVIIPAVTGTGLELELQTQCCNNCEVTDGFLS